MRAHADGVRPGSPRRPFQALVSDARRHGPRDPARGHWTVIACTVSGLASGLCASTDHMDPASTHTTLPGRVYSPDALAMRG